MTNRASKIIVLCEDAALRMFAWRFLCRGFGVDHRNLSIVPLPKATGSGKHHVMEKVAAQAKARRSRHAATLLIVIVDADNMPVDVVCRLLDARTQRTTADQCIAYIIPKWSIETWLAYLDRTGTVDEADPKSYKDRYGKLAVSKEAHPWIDALAERCHNQIPLQAPPHSLELACAEFSNLRPTL